MDGLSCRTYNTIINFVVYHKYDLGVAPSMETPIYHITTRCVCVLFAKTLGGGIEQVSLAAALSGNLPEK